jgi:hypothetical protein
MNGLVVEGEPHIHVTLATQAGAYGDIWKKVVSPTSCARYFLELSGRSLSRQRVPISVPGMGEGEVSRLIFSETCAAR